MVKLHPEVKIELTPSRAIGPGAIPGHGWCVFRNGKPIGTGFAAGDVKEALEDAVDDLRMLGLVTEQ